MIVETVEDWNLVLEGCGCCEMPSCPVPTRECESRTISNGDCSQGLIEDEDPPDGVFYGCWVTWARPSGDDGDLIPAVYRKSTFTGEIGDYVGGDITYSCGQQTATASFDGGSWSITISESLTYSQFFDSLLATIEEEEWNESGSCVSSLSVGWPTIGSYDWDIECEVLWLSHISSSNPRNFNLSSSLTASRFKWVIPDTWTGSYFKITWDEVFVAADPEAGNLLIARRSWIWDGPGDPEDEETWKSDWYELTPPNEPGEVRVGNILFECYKSAKFGTRPQTTGEAYEITE
jgi:hypothetical protein